MTVTLSGMTSSVMESNWLKALAPMLVTPSSMISFVMKWSYATQGGASLLEYPSISPVPQMVITVPSM
jgi:hypothetical protein